MSVLPNLPQVPMTLEGAFVLHQMFRVDRSALSTAQLKPALKEAVKKLSAMPQTAAFAMLGHKSDLMLLHFRNSLAELQAAQLAIHQLKISRHFELTTSYVSVIELGLYESSVKTYREMMDRGLRPESEEWKTAMNDVMQRQREAMHSRLFPEVPNAKHICFYPMDRKRGEHKNWYRLPIEERQRQMHEHGLIGRKYAGEVKQIITGSIGLDDWEWGVDLFAEDPLVFKKLIYEMRFDEVSADYALFGQFYVGLRCKPEELGKIIFGI